MAFFSLLREWMDVCLESRKRNLKINLSGALRRTKNRPSSGFTLFELLVVICILGILFSIVIPLMGTVRDTAKLTLCMSNLRQVGTATLVRHSNQQALWRTMMGIFNIPNRCPNPVGLWAKTADDPDRSSESRSCQTPDEINWPELADYIGIPVSNLSQMRSVTHCPFSGGKSINDNAYWADRGVFNMDYFYAGQVSRWSMWASNPELVSDKHPNATAILGGDSIFRFWDGHWYANHLPGYWKTGVPPMKAVNQMYGDGHVERRPASLFDPVLMERGTPNDHSSRWIYSWACDKYYF